MMNAGISSSAAASPDRGRRPRLQSALADAWARCWPPLVWVGLFSAAINLLALSGSLYMIQLYDRVLPSRSIPTLVGLTIVLLLLYAASGVFDLLRTRLLSRIGVRLDRTLREPVFAAVMLLPIRTRAEGDGLQPVRDLDQIRGFLSGLGPTALFDLPWMPFFLGIVYILHPWLGLLGAGGAVILVVLTLLTEARSRQPTREAAQSTAARHSLGEAARRNAEAIRALGMTAPLMQQWSRINERSITQHTKASDVGATYGSMSKVLRMVLQSGVLGLGAYLAVQGEVSPGVMIAASILVARALAPVEIAIAHWRGFVAARQSLARLSKLLALTSQQTETLELPRPSVSLSVESLTVAAPGTQLPPIIQNVTFSLKSGDGLGIIGPSASGKSTLARALVGAWMPQKGAVRIDGAALDQWPPDALGKYVGYLPQDIELFSGTVAQNIARFDPGADIGTIISAAMKADVHELILRLPDGYNTQIGERGLTLSAGQRQRIALARALHGEPFLVILDEPNSNLDSEGDAALQKAITSVRSRGGIVIAVAHRPSVLVALDSVLAMARGQVQAFGAKDEVLKSILLGASNASSAPHLKIISDTQIGA